MMLYLTGAIAANFSVNGDLIPRNTPWVLTVDVSLTSTSSSINYIKLSFPSSYIFSDIALDGALVGGSYVISSSHIEIFGFTMNPSGNGRISIRDIRSSRSEGLDSFLVILANSTDTFRTYLKLMIIREDTTVPLLFFHKSLRERPFLLNRNVRVRGTVSAVIGSKAYIQDTIRDTLSGIVIYGYSDVSVGEFVKVFGRFSPYRGLEEIINPVVEYREYVGAPSPLTVDRLTLARELLSGVLIRIDSVKIPDTLTYIPPSTNISIKDKYGNDGYLYIDRYSGIEGFTPPDTIFDLIGLVDEDSSSSGNIYRIIPRTAQDIIFYSSVYARKVIPLFNLKNTSANWKIPLYSINTTAKLRVCSDNLTVSEISGVRLGLRSPDSVFTLSDTSCAQFWGIHMNEDTLFINTEPKSADSVMIYLYSSTDTLLNFKRSIYSPRLYYTLPIRDVQARNPGEYSSALEGQRVFVGGVVLSDNMLSRGISTYIYDGTGGVNIYSSSSAGIRKGNVVLVKGTVMEYNGLTEVVIDSFRIIGEDTLPHPIKLSYGTGLNEDLEGLLVKVDTVPIATLPIYAGIGKSFTVYNGSAPITVYVYPNTNINLEEIKPGKFVSVIGIVGQYSTTPPYNTGYQLIPRSRDDLILLSGNFQSESLSVVINKNVFIPGSENATFEVKGPEGIYDIKIYDDVGRLVKIIVSGNQGGGIFLWDGRNSQGRVMPPGAYVLYVSVKTRDGKILKKVKPIVISTK